MIKPCRISGLHVHIHPDERDIIKTWEHQGGQFWRMRSPSPDGFDSIPVYFDGVLGHPVIHSQQPNETVTR